MIRTFYAQARALEEQLTAWRRDIHMHPEIGFQEQRTSKLVADMLRVIGLRVETGIGKTGVIGYLGEGRPAIGIRADMDALPLQEMNDVPYASKTPDVMHACGHDAHTAMLLGRQAETELRAAVGSDAIGQLQRLLDQSLERVAAPA